MGVCKKCTFKLVGFMNVFGNIPGFVFPIYVGENGRMHCVTGRQEDCTIESFVEVRLSDLKLIKLFEEHKVKTNQIESIESFLGSKFIFLFQTSENFVQIGDYNQLKEYLEKFETEDEILKEEIKDFVEGRV